MTNIRGISLCSLSMIVTLQYVRDALGSVLFPDRLLHKTARWGPGQIHHLLDFSLPFFSFLYPQHVFFFLSALLQTQYLQNRSSMTVRTQSSAKASRHFFPLFSLQSFCYHISLGILQSLVRGPAFLPLVEWYKTWQNSISVKLGVRWVYSLRDWYVGQKRSSRRKKGRNRGASADS